MNTEHLKTDEDRAHVAKRIAGTSLDDHDAWIRFWSGTSIQLDGDFTADELTLLADIMRTLPSANASNQTPPPRA